MVCTGLRALWLFENDMFSAAGKGTFGPRESWAEIQSNTRKCQFQSLPRAPCARWLFGMQTLRQGDTGLLGAAREGGRKEGHGA